MLPAWTASLISDSTASPGRSFSVFADLLELFEQDPVYPDARLMLWHLRLRMVCLGLVWESSATQQPRKPRPYEV